MQTEILEAVATGSTVAEVANLLCLRAEMLAPSALCSILLIQDGLLHPIASPSLPASFSAAFDGLAIGPVRGSCGTAAYFGTSVEVADIATDPLWEGYGEGALSLGLLACWSSPIMGRDGRAMATFAFYYRTKRGPSPIERAIVAACVHVFTIALEHATGQEMAYRLAYHDQLTGLPNYRQFQRLMDERLARPGTPFGLLLIDVDHLKVTNDSFGHAVGDQLLQLVAERLSSLETRLPSIACRIGGDEFAVFVDGCKDYATLADKAAELLAATRPSYPSLASDEAAIDSQITIGGVIAGLDGWEPDVLRQNADFALYHAKDVCRGGYVAFEKSMRSLIVNRIDTVRRTADALMEGRIVAHYQPLARLDTGRLIGLEALVRMTLPNGRIATAGSFLAGFSDSRVAVQLTSEMLRQVTTDMKAWLDDGVMFEQVGINVSPVDFRRGDIESRICNAFADAGVPLKHLVLEITESVFMEDPRGEMLRTIASLRERGALVALDDFGTGFASLTHLITVPVDIIKIDKSFIDRLMVHRPSAVIIEALIDIALKMGLKIVAEGVTSEGQRRRLVELGCTLGQGHLFAEASDAATTTRLFRDNHAVHDALVAERTDLRPVIN